MAFFDWTSNTSGNTEDVSSLVANGFQSGSVISAKQVNTVLRQSTLITVALMNSLGIADKTYINTVNEIKTEIDTKLTALIKGTKVDNAIDADNATNASSATNATNAENTEITNGTWEEITLTSATGNATTDKILPNKTYHMKLLLTNTSNISGWLDFGLIFVNSGYSAANGGKTFSMSFADFGGLSENAGFVVLELAPTSNNTYVQVKEPLQAGMSGWSGKLYVKEIK